MSAITQPTEAPWTFGRLLNWTTRFLSEQGVEEARLGAEVLLAHAARCRRIDLYTRFEEIPDAVVVGKFREGVRRAADNEPIAYLVGEKEFFSLTFAVTPAVLIPRPETETLVEQVLEHCRRQNMVKQDVFDLGTGSGCIVVTLLKHLPNARAVASDISSDALEIARANAERHNVADRLRLVQADRFNLPADAIPDDGFDILVCNPPYVEGDAVESLHAGVRKYEPHIALTDHEDGLSFYRTIARDAPGMLVENALVAVETGDGQADAAKRILESGGSFAHLATIRDRVVRHERTLLFSRSRAKNGSEA